MCSSSIVFSVRVIVCLAYCFVNQSNEILRELLHDPFISIGDWIFSWSLCFITVMVTLLLYFHVPLFTNVIYHKYYITGYSVHRMHEPKFCRHREYTVKFLIIFTTAFHDWSTFTTDFHDWSTTDYHNRSIFMIDFHDLLNWSIGRVACGDMQPCSRGLKSQKSRE